MAFQNVTMTKEERDWERTLDMKDPRSGYKRDINGRPKGSSMTVDRERRIYLFGIDSDKELREPPSENDIHFFMLLWDGGRLYLAANQIINYDIKEVFWHIKGVDLLINETGLSKKELIDYLTESIEEYGENGLDGSINPKYKGNAVFKETLYRGNWITG